MGFPLRSFWLFAAVASVSWGLDGALLGYVGGVAFEDDPLKGVAVGIGLALSVTAAVEGIRFLRRRPAGAGSPTDGRDGGQVEQAAAVRVAVEQVEGVGPMPGV